MAAGRAAPAVTNGKDMAKRFSMREGAVEGETYFDRQKLITWWDQERLAGALVMVVGAGALGNETIKNLLLLGFRNLFICDLDHIETSNLSRTVLFAPGDIGRSKAHTAAERARTLCLTRPSDRLFPWRHHQPTRPRRLPRQSTSCWIASTTSRRGASSSASAAGLASRG